MAATVPDAIPYVSTAERQQNADVPDLSQEIAERVQELFLAYLQTAIDYTDARIPPGVVWDYYGLTPPPGWALCDGSAHGSAALLAISGSAYTPDLRGKFVLGAGNGYNRGSTGGASTVTLTAAQSGLRAHNHTATESTLAPTITVKGPANLPTGEETSGALGGSGIQIITDGSGEGAGGNPITATQAGHAHTISIANVASANATSPHENMPPYYVLVKIIKL